MLLIASDTVQVRNLVTDLDGHGHQTRTHVDGWAGSGNLQLDQPAVTLTGEGQMWRPVTRLTGTLHLPTQVQIGAGDEVEVNGRLWRVRSVHPVEGPGTVLDQQAAYVDAGDWWTP